MFKLMVTNESMYQSKLWHIAVCITKEARPEERGPDGQLRSVLEEMGKRSHAVLLGVGKGH